MTGGHFLELLPYFLTVFKLLYQILVSWVYIANCGSSDLPNHLISCTVVPVRDLVIIWGRRIGRGSTCGGAGLLIEHPICSSVLNPLLLLMGNLGPCPLAPSLRVLDTLCVLSMCHAAIIVGCVIVVLSRSACPPCASACLNNLLPACRNTEEMAWPSYAQIAVPVLMMGVNNWFLSVIPDC